MSNAVTFKDVCYSDIVLDFSCEINVGDRALIVTAGEEESAVLTRLITGMSVPEQGLVALFGETTAELSPDKLTLVRRKLGIIPFNGGLVSNLKMWENIFLPYYYHVGVPVPVDEKLAIKYLNKLNCTGNYMAFPAHLSLFEKRVAAFTRAATMRPDIMIYCNTLERISKSEQACLAAVMDEFHLEKAGRTSIYMGSSADLAVQLKFDAVLHLHPHKNAGSVT